MPLSTESPGKTSNLTGSTVNKRLIVALDVSSAGQAQRIVSALGEAVHVYKVGMQLYTAEGPGVVRELVRAGKEIFLDLKYHDIPNTVGAAVREAAQLGVSMLTVHASGATKMLEAAVEASRSSATRNPQIIAVTVLTSLDEAALRAIGIPGKVEDQVIRLASTALKAGCAGVVSSAQEVAALRANLGKDFVAVTPGVRPAGADAADQARVVTPSRAIAAGATHIVVGRPITEAPNPAAAAAEILDEIKRASI
jgi:orotidine-5'-phosphate decarboxylase